MDNQPTLPDEQPPAVIDSAAPVANDLSFQVTDIPESLRVSIPPERNARFSKKLIVALVIIVVLALGAGAWLLFGSSKAPEPAVTKASTKSKLSAQTVQALKLDPDKDYGDKYADGLLPIGDGKYTTDNVQKGYVYACSGYAQNLGSDPGGADVRGTWFSSDNTRYDINKKLHVSGSVTWASSFSNTVNSSTRIITSNDLPNHFTGVYPIQSSDPAYSFDRNPNSIKGQSISFSLPLKPTYTSPQCINGQVGIMLTGVELFSAFDAGGRDAGAWEIQDSCNGHPEKTGAYHYHTLSSCIKDTGIKTIIGYALDGFPITGPKLGPGNILTTSDLDECHGIVSDVTLDNKTVKTYHYVMTQDFPYSISCYRSKPIQTQSQAAGGSGAPSQTRPVPRPR